ncbi:nose resistant to fluoxetine protein 6-like [Prorops nasuta]|uniref:nose resistant to fluoxetine protein 6-like n=1 Tax=Prorops nasuta TaxID=863751 RepID=UPI0034CE10B0
MKMAVRWFLVWFVVAGSVIGESQILSIESPLQDSLHPDLEYDNYNSESILPLLSRDITLLQRAIDMIDDSSCREQSQLMLSSIRNLTSWAVKFYDASGKFPEGVLSGSMYQLGNFDECLAIGQDDDTPAGIKGKYCLAEVDIQVPESYLKKEGTIWEFFKDNDDRNQESINRMYWGICVPASCVPRSIEDLLERVLAVAFSNSKLKLASRIPEKSCYLKEAPVAKTGDIIYMCIILSVISCVIGSTIFHTACLRRKGQVPTGILPQILLSFSMISNVKKLFGPAHDDDLRIDVISGIKFISMVFIVAGHTLIFVISGPVFNKRYWEEAITKVENSLFLNNPLLVDTFLLISGFLFSRILLRELDKRKSVNFLLLYICRYIRLTPAYLVVIGLYVTWLPRLDSGPLWSRMEIEKERCLNSWWTNILYINNYVDTNHLCMFQSWYLSVDTQLFILAPAMIYPLWKWRRIGELFMVFVTTASIIVPFVNTLTNNLDPTLMIYKSEVSDISMNDYYRNNYIKTHMRASSYCFGLICGYIVYRLHTGDYRLSKITVRIGWLLGSLSLLGAMCSISIFYGPRKDFTPLEAAIYAGMHRAFWSIGICWILITCVTDNAGPIRNFLKWRGFVPLSRLTYSAYLINGLVVLHYIATVRAPQHLDTYNLAAIVFSHLTITFGGAVFLSTIFESPILGLERVLLGKQDKKIKNQSHGETTHNEET